jgi:hypothetical protein
MKIINKRQEVRLIWKLLNKVNNKLLKIKKKLILLKINKFDKID